MRFEEQAGSRCTSRDVVAPYFPVHIDLPLRCSPTLETDTSGRTFKAHQQQQHHRQGFANTQSQQPTS